MNVVARIFDSIYKRQLPSMRPSQPAASIKARGWALFLPQTYGISTKKQAVSLIRQDMPIRSTIRSTFWSLDNGAAE